MVDHAKTAPSGLAHSDPDQLVLHQYQVSPFAAKVRRCLYYKGVDFEVVNYGLAGMRKIRKLNPRAKAPILEHRGELIPDSTDIVRYLDKIYPDKPVIPNNAADSALAHVLEDWADESLYFYDLTMRSWPNNANLLADDLVMADSGLAKKFFHRIIPSALARQAHGQGTGRKDRDAVCADADRHFQAIVALVEQSGWLVASRLSIADIAVASMCTVLERAEEAKACMETYPILVAWRERVDEATLPGDTPRDQRALV